MARFNPDDPELEGLRDLARQYADFEDFSTGYSLKNYHGRYVHLTTDPNFQVNRSYSPRDLAWASDSGEPGFMVSTDPENWAATFKDQRRYMVIVELPGARPGLDFNDATRGFGHELMVTNLSKVKVIQVLPYSQGLSEWNRRYDQVIPQSEDDLRKLWEQAHGRMSKVATWEDIVYAAQRLRAEGRVNLLTDDPLHAVAEVEGDTGTYQTEVWRDNPGDRTLTRWSCDCPWGQYSWGRTRQWKKYEGRPCKHALATFYEAMSQEFRSSRRTRIAGLEFDFGGDQVGPQYSGWIAAYLDGFKVGWIDYGYFEDAIYIQYIFVEPEYRRRGIATALLQKLRVDNPGVPVEPFGGLTPEGSQWWRTTSRRLSRHGWKRVFSWDSEVPKWDPSEGDGPSIPSSHVRLFHRSPLRNLDSIKQNGLTMSNAHGMSYSEPNTVWATARPPKDRDWAQSDFLMVEFHVDTKDLDIGSGRSPSDLESRRSDVTLMRDVRLSEILAIHEPWHFTYRYLDEYRDSVLKGEYDNIQDDPGSFPNESRAITTIKQEHGITSSRIGQKQPDHSQGIMVAVSVSDDVIAKLKVEDGVDDAHHITLAYLGNLKDKKKDDDPDPPADVKKSSEWPELEKAVRSVAKGFGPITVQGQETDRFEKGPDGIPFILKMESEGLTKLRAALVKELKSRDIVFSEKFDFKPHVTIKYMEEDEADPLTLDEPVSFTVDQIDVVVGTNITSIPLGIEKIGWKAATAVMYHVTRSTLRDSISRHGLTPDESEAWRGADYPWTWLWDDYDAAIASAKKNTEIWERHGWKFDIWHVDASDLEVVLDPHGPYEHAWATTERIPPARLLKVETFGGDELRVEGWKRVASGPYYHGSHLALQPGEILRPPSITGIEPRWDEGYSYYKDFLVYLTNLNFHAGTYAINSAKHFGGEPHVYEVQPLLGLSPDGPVVEQDPEAASGFGTDQYITGQARVIREVPMDEWWVPRRHDYIWKQAQNIPQYVATQVTVQSRGSEGGIWHAGIGETYDDGYATTLCGRRGWVDHAFGGDPLPATLDREQYTENEYSQPVECAACRRRMERTGKRSSDLPTIGMFSPGADHLDPRLFDEAQKLRSNIREGIIALLDQFFAALNLIPTLVGGKPGGLEQWQTWAKPFIAGSSASYWWTSDRDLDILLGVEYDRFEMATGIKVWPMLSTDLNKVIDEVTEPLTGDLWGFRVTFHFNPQSYDIKKIRPYAAYDIVEDVWAVKPVQVPKTWGPEWFSRNWWRKAREERATVEQVIAQGDSVAAGVEFTRLYRGRQQAYRAGNGWLDYRQFLWQALEAWGVLRKLHELSKQPQVKIAARPPGGFLFHRDIGFPSWIWLPRWNGQVRWSLHARDGADYDENGRVDWENLQWVQVRPEEIYELGVNPDGSIQDVGIRIESYEDDWSEPRDLIMVIAWPAKVVKTCWTNLKIDLHDSLSPKEYDLPSVAPKEKRKSRALVPA